MSDLTPLRSRTGNKKENWDYGISQEPEIHLRLHDAPWRSPAAFERKGEILTTLEEISDDIKLPGIKPCFIKWVELRKYTHWLEWRHEFVVFCCSTIDAESNELEFFIRIDRGWAAPEGWRQYIPSGWRTDITSWKSYIPITGSAKPASGEAQISLFRPIDDDTLSIAQVQITSNDNRHALSGLTILSYAYRISEWCAGYALFGANCWSFSRTLLVLAFYQWSEEPQPINVFMAGKRVCYHTFRAEYASDPWTLETAALSHNRTRRAIVWPKHSPSVLHRVQLICAYLFQPLIKIFSSLQLYESYITPRRTVTAGSIDSTGWIPKDGHLSYNTTKITPFLGNPPLSPNWQFENCCRPQGQPWMILASQALYFKRLHSITIRLGVLECNEDVALSMRGSFLQVAIIREIAGDITTTYPPHSTLYIQEHQRSNLSDAGPDEALRFLVLRRRFVPFNDHFDEGGLQWSKTLDPSFFGDEIHYGDRISLWLDNKAHGMNVGRRETSIEVDATWVQLPPSKFDESV